MNITVECIHRSRDTKELNKYNTDFPKNNIMYEHNKVTCHINSNLTETRFYLPKESIVLNDVMNFSSQMTVHQHYDCVLEIASFKQVDLYTNHAYSIRGLYRCKISQRWLPDYQLYNNSACIELTDGIILFSPYNNILANSLSDGELVEIIPQSNLNLLSLINCF